MAEFSRREALRFLGTGAAVTTVAAEAAASGAGQAPIGVEKPEVPPEAVGLFYDATLCIGCKACVSSCAEVNALVPDTTRAGGLWQMPTQLNTQTKNIIQLYQDKSTGAESFVKRQCMHCLDPACVAGCPFGALQKDGRSGIVSWQGDRCIGCRYCEVACPFEVPKFEWAQFNPRIVKCELCSHRLAEGKQPGCTEVCPTSAVVFGKRVDLLREAKARVAASPGKYHQDHVYGETEAGGTQVLMLASVPYEKLGMPKLLARSVSHYATWVHTKVYSWMAGPALVFGAMMFFIQRNWKKHQAEVEKEKQETGLDPQY